MLEQRQAMQNKTDMSRNGQVDTLRSIERTGSLLRRLRRVEELNRKVNFDEEEVASEETPQGSKDEPEIIDASQLSQSRYSVLPPPRRRRSTRFSTQLYASQRTFLGSNAGAKSQESRPSRAVQSIKLISIDTEKRLPFIAGRYQAKENRSPSVDSTNSRSRKFIS